MNVKVFSEIAEVPIVVVAVVCWDGGGLPSLLPAPPPPPAVVLALLASIALLNTSSFFSLSATSCRTRSRYSESDLTRFFISGIVTLFPGNRTFVGGS